MNKPQSSGSSGQHYTQYPKRMARRIGVASVSVLAASLAVAGCSSSTSSSSSASGGPSVAGSSQAAGAASKARASAQDVKAATVKFEDAQKPLTGFTAPGPKVDASKLKGKTVWYIPLDYNDAFFHIVAGQMKKALGTAGVNLQICDGKGNPGTITACMEQAIGAHASVIIADGPTPAIIGNEMKKATQQKIPVIMGDLLDQNSPIPKNAAAVVANAPTAEGKVFGNAFISLSEGKSDVLALSTTEVAQGALYLNSAKSVIQAACSACKMKVLNVPISKWPTELQADVKAQLTADPNIHYIIAAFDSMSPFILPAIKGTDVKVITQNANLPAMKDLKAGGNVVVDIGSDMGWQAWAYADQSFRLMTGQKPVVEKVPFRAFTHQNSQSLDLTLSAAASQDWYGSKSLTQQMESGFKTLWNVNG